MHDSFFFFLVLGTEIEPSVNLPKTPTEKLFQNLGLLSEVSVLIPEEEVTHQDPYAIDAKLNFLCGFRLLPTPLVKRCPNATKKWLRAATDSLTVCDDKTFCTTGINYFDDPAYLSQTVNFDCFLMNNFEEELPSIATIKESDIANSNNVQNLKEFSKEKSMSSNCHASANQGFDSVNELLFPENISNEIVTHQQQQLLKAKSPVFYKLISDLKRLPALIQKEIFDMEINQTTFAKASINKTQGYLSEMLQKCSGFTEDPPKMSPLFRNLNKMKQFLSLPQSLRTESYKKAKENLKKLENPGSNIRKTQSRTRLSEATKESLIQFYQQFNGILSPSHIGHLSRTHELPEKIIKVFYKNMKLRKKL